LDSATCHMQVSTFIDYYRFFGLDVTASRDDISHAWKMTALRHHPDKPGCGCSRPTVPEHQFVSERLVVVAALHEIEIFSTAICCQMQLGTFESKPHRGRHHTNANRQRGKGRFARPRSRRIHNSQLRLHMLRENAALRASVDILYIYK
jgi:hypothetical protein